MLPVLSALASSSSSPGLRSYLLGRAGDCCFMIVQDWAHVDTHRKNYAYCTRLDRDIKVEVDKDMVILGISIESRTIDREYGMVADCFKNSNTQFSAIVNVNE